MTHKHTALVLVVSLLYTHIALAAGAPPNVKNVKVTADSSAVTVTWDAVNDASGIDFYRIYFSRESILNNRGNFDDFERTDGPLTSFTFSRVPYPGKTVFFSVMAVNKAGLESEAFESEASIVTPGSAPVSSASSVSVSSSVSSVDSSASSSSAVLNGIELVTVVSATALSSTGVALVFSKPLDSIKGAQNATAYLIVDGSGTMLPVKKATLSGALTVVLTTDAQQPGRVYSYALMQPIGAVDGATTPTPPPEGTFVGWQGNGMAFLSSSSSSAVVVDRTPPEDPLSLSLTPTLRADRNYSVRAVWAASINTTNDLSSYVVYTTRDGTSFSMGTPLSASTLNAVYTGVPAGRFGVKVTARDTSGNESRGIVRMIDLPKSGIPLLGVAALAGALAGGRTARRRRDCDPQ